MKPVFDGPSSEWELVEMILFHDPQTFLADSRHVEPSAAVRAHGVPVYEDRRG